MGLIEKIYSLFTNPNLMSFLRKIVIRLILPIWWKIFKNAPAIALNKFAITEVDSAWQSLYALEAAQDPEIKAKLFRHAYEEIAHGELFNDIAQKVSPTLLPRLSPERDPLLKTSDSKGFTQFYADEYIGEQRIQIEFETYYNAVPLKPVQEVFGKVKKDEKGHAIYTSRMLDKLVNSEPLKRKYQILRARGKYLHQSWLRVSKVLGEINSDILLKIVYFAVGFLLKPSCQQALHKNQEKSISNTTQLKTG